MHFAENPLIVPVVIPRDVPPELLVEQHVLDPLGSVLGVGETAGREGRGEGGGEVGEDEPAGGVDAVHGGVLDFEEVEWPGGRVLAGEDEGLVPGEAVVVG